MLSRRFPQHRLITAVCFIIPTVAGNLLLWRSPRDNKAALLAGLYIVRISRSLFGKTKEEGVKNERTRRWLTKDDMTVVDILRCSGAALLSGGCKRRRAFEEDRDHRDHYSHGQSRQLLRPVGLQGQPGGHRIPGRSNRNSYPDGSIHRLLWFALV